MGLIRGLKRDLRYLQGLRRLLGRIKPIQLDSDVLISDDFEEVVDKYPDNLAIDDGERRLTYRDLDALANRYAHWAAGRGLRRGDVIALMMHNRADYLAAWIGFSKAGMATALINTNLDGQPLAHCLGLVGAGHVVTDLECWPCIERARPHVERPLMSWVLGLGPSDEASDRRGLDTAVKSASGVRPAKSTRAGLTNRDTALYIYTSGTTGLPKAARIPHSRARTYMRAFAGATASTEKDRLYCVLPLYHSTGGLVGVGSVLLNGGAIILRKKFSAGAFWPDVVESRATTFVYIGELCRYLVNAPPSEGERGHRLRLAFGNGLRPEVWPEFQSRFAIPQVLEFYGSTEGNASLFNFDGKQGAVGRIPRYLRSRLNIRIVRYDVDADEVVRGSDGLCREASPGEVGELIGEIRNDVRHDYSGYADKAASKSKVLTDVFRRGDRWFRTGDLMKQDRDGYFYFVDRIGDTFRWKGENVSTTEVEQHLAQAPAVEQAVVYGVAVPGQDGKAGMATLIVQDNFEPRAFAEFVDQALPPYARPVFLRTAKAVDTTGTFKYRKIDMVRDGYAPGGGKGQVYVKGGKNGYARLTAKAHEAILSGETRL